MSGNLTIGTKGQINDILSERVFGKRIREMEDKVQQAADAIVEDVWGEKDFEALKRIISRAPYLATASRRFYFDGCSSVAAKYPAPADLDLSQHKLYAALLKAVEERAELRKEQSRFSTQVRAILQPIKTYKKLYAVWPELEELKAQIGDTDQVIEKGKSLAVQVDSLNKLLGLPTPTKVEVETKEEETPKGKKVVVKRKAPARKAA